MNKCAAITLLGVLVGAGTAATADDVRTEIYAEGARTGGPKALYWDIYTAEAGGEGRALVLLHGGGCRDGSRNDRRLVELAQQLAQDGITVVCPDYRLLADNPSPRPYSVASMAEAASEIWLPDILASGNSGAAAQEILQTRVTACAAAAEDALAAWRAVRDRAPELGLDPERIALGGSSAGALASLVAAYELAADQERPYAVVTLRGAAPGLAFTYGGPPLWALHGAEDTVVPLAAARKTVSRARRANVRATLRVQPAAGHSWTEMDLFELRPDGKTHYQLLLDFLRM